MHLEKRFKEVFLTDGTAYVIERGHNDDMYEIEYNHLIKVDQKKVGWFVFKHWVPDLITLGEIQKEIDWE